MQGDAARVTARRERLGISKAALAREAKVSRTTLAAIEAGQGFNRSTLAKIETSLTRLEKEYGINVEALPAKDETTTIEVQLPDGSIARVITKGPTNADDIAAQVAAILQRMSPRRE